MKRLQALLELSHLKMGAIRLLWMLRYVLNDMHRANKGGRKDTAYLTCTTGNCTIVELRTCAIIILILQLCVCESGGHRKPFDPS